MVPHKTRMSSESENPVHPGSGATTEELLAYIKAGGRELALADIRAELANMTKLIVVEAGDLRKHFPIAARTNDEEE